MITRKKRKFRYRVASYFIGVDIEDVLHRYKTVIFAMDEALRKVAPYSGSFEESIADLRREAKNLTKGHIDVEEFRRRVEY